MWHNATALPGPALMVFGSSLSPVGRRYLNMDIPDISNCIPQIATSLPGKIKHLCLELVLTLTCLPVQAAELRAETEDLLNMDLEALLQMQISVSALSGRTQDLSTAAAAAYVFTADDILHSPAHSVPDLLRTVPGIQVVQIDANKWAISARGFNSRIASKLLVLIDGRNLYSPTFSTVFWESEDLPLDQIERIEIIRGPGATIWGANAVNGVISITSKNSAATLGTTASLVTGDVDTYIAQFQHSNKIGTSTSFRVYGKFRDRAESRAVIGGGANDDWNASRAGFRLDSQPDARNIWRVQGDIYNQDMNQTLTTLFSRFAQLDNVSDHISQRGSNLQANWIHEFRDGSQLTSRISYDYRYRQEAILAEKAKIYDLDLRWNNNDLGKHKITIGAGIKSINHALEGTPYFMFDPARETLRYSNIAFYDDISLTERTIVGISLKAEDNIFTGLEYQPNLKLTHILNSQNTFWAAITRAVRIPSRAERDSTFPLYYLGADAIPGVPVPVFLQLEAPDKKLDVEKQRSTEAGWRYHPSANFSLDTTVFFNQYKGLRNVYLGTPRCEPDPTCLFFAHSIVQPIHVANLDFADTYGLEVLASQQINADLSLESSLSVVNIEYENNSGLEQFYIGALSPGVGQPMVKVNSQVNWQINATSSFTGIYRYVSSPNVGDIDSYHVVDLMYRRQFTPHVEASLAARNLGSTHDEFAEFLIQQPIGYVEPSFHLMLDWRW